MIKEVTNSFKAALYQRVSSPLYGTYTFTWLIYNWKITIPLFLGDSKFDSRLETFTKALYDGNQTFLYSTVLVPIVITAVILLLQPVLQRYLFVYSELHKSEGLKKRDKYNSETMLTLEQSNELRASVQKVQLFHQDVMKNKDEEINEYKKQAINKSDEIVKINEEILNLIERKSEFESENSSLNAKLIADSNDFESKIKSLEDELEKVKNQNNEVSFKANSFEKELVEQKVINSDLNELNNKNLKKIDNILKDKDSENEKNKSVHEEIRRNLGFTIKGLEENINRTYGKYIRSWELISKEDANKSCA